MERDPYEIPSERNWKLPLDSDNCISNTIRINNLEDINVFISKNNSGKTNVLTSIYSLTYQDIERSNIFHRLKFKLDKQDFELIIENFHNKILNIYRNLDISSPKDNQSELKILFLFQFRYKKTFSKHKIYIQFFHI